MAILHRQSKKHVHVRDDCTHLAIVYADDVRPFRDVKTTKNDVIQTVVAALPHFVSLADDLRHLPSLIALAVMGHDGDYSFGDVRDLSFLTGARHICYLDLAADPSNAIRDTAHLSVLEDLRFFEVNDYLRWDLAHLSSRRLEGLSAYCPSIKNVQRLREFRQLKCLVLSQFQWADLKIFSELTKLEEFRLIAGRVPTAAGLETLKRLRTLELSRVGLKDASALRQLTELRYLELTANRDLRDIAFLENLRSLRVLKMLSVPWVESFKPLGALCSLERLSLCARALDGDLSALRGLVPRLRECYLHRSVEKVLA